MRNALAVLMLAALLCSGSAWAQKKKVVCWNDDRGQRMCGDSVPPQYAKKEQQILNERGVVVETRAHEKTADELAAEAQKAEDAKKAEEQARYDSYLVQTYNKVSDLEAVRKERIATLDGRLTLAQKAVTDMQVTVKTLHERAETLKKNNKPLDKALAKQIRDFDKALLDSLASVEALKQDREKTLAKFDTDIARFRELRPEAPAAPATTP